MNGGFLADDPAADPWAPEEVRPAAMPSRVPSTCKFHCVMFESVLV